MNQQEEKLARVIYAKVISGRNIPNSNEGIDEMRAIARMSLQAARTFEETKPNADDSKLPVLSAEDLGLAPKEDDKTPDMFKENHVPVQEIDFSAPLGES